MPWYTGLARVAKRTGYPVVEMKGWKKNGHRAMSGCQAIICHHDVSNPSGGNAPLRNYIYNNKLSHYQLGRDGTIYVIGAGFMGHAGKDSLVRPAHARNATSIGIEAANNGTGEAWSTKQLDAYVKLVRALIDEFKLPVSRVYGHKEIAIPKGRKVDPNFSNPSMTMDQFRAYVRAGSYKGAKPAASKPSKPKSKPAQSTPRGKVGGEWPANPLAVDGKFWLVSKRGYQRLLAPKAVGDYRGTIDGKIGPRTVKAEQRWLKKLGYYGRGYIVDGQRGPATIKALQRFLKAKGLYSGVIDGKFQTLSIRGLQQYMNNQRKHYS